MEIDVENSVYGQRAKQLFLEGYNCSQSVFLAFEDKYDMDHSTAMKLSSSFGGGMGRLREVCGAVSGMFMVAGILYGYDEPKDFEGKSEHYARIQQLAAEYQKRNGSIVCRELLGLAKVRMTRLRQSGRRSIIRSVHARIWQQRRRQLWRHISGNRRMHDKMPLERSCV